MDVLKLKILLANLLPSRLLTALAAFSYIGVGLLSRLPVLRMSDFAIARRVSRNQVSESDRARILSKPNSGLANWAAAFEGYGRDQGGRPVKLAWTHKPAGGNYGDWLSPYIVSRVTGRPVLLQDLSSMRRIPHILSLGSIISRANRHSIVLGSGINHADDYIDGGARFYSVRGEYTLRSLPKNARSSELICCDPGFFIHKIYPSNCRTQFGRRLLIPHINHHSLFSGIKDSDFRILSAKACRPVDLEKLIDEICSAELVVTSAMHVFITCCAYNVRCALIKPQTTEYSVPGDGIKYRDSMSPVWGKDFFPQVVKIDPDMKIMDEVDCVNYKIDFDHIDKAFVYFKNALLEN